MRFLLLLVVLLAGCHEYHLPQTETGRIEIVKVFMHQPSGGNSCLPNYSVMSIDKNKKVTVHDLRYYAELYADVPAGEPMWLEWTSKEKFIIHIHSVGEVGGGGYKLGKAPEVKTNVIE
jgi:hypothetical protein